MPIGFQILDRALRVIRFLLPILGLLLVWELAVRTGLAQAGILPAPSTILARAVELLGLTGERAVLLGHILASLRRALVAFALAVAVGVPLGFLLGLSEEAQLWVSPILSLMLPLPAVAWTPILLVLFGPGDLTIVVVCFLGAVFPVLYSTMQGVRACGRQPVWVVRSMGGSGLDVLRRVLIPSSLPALITGFKLGMAHSWRTLVAAEMQHDGLPWDRARHDALLTGMMGPRPVGGGRPRRLEDLAATVRTLLDDPRLNPDSQPHLLASLRRQGFSLASTSKWEVRELDHPVVEPLLEYKRLSRLLSANGWAWLDAWVHDGRFRPTYVVGGVVTGRWATDGGGALQLPVSLRGAAHADPGWRLVVADAAQLEPRVLAAMSGDRAMSDAARASDLYQGIADAGIVATRTDAKYALLGAIYGATTGASAMLMPRLTRAYPRAVALVEDAARAGERGEPVSTWLGRTSPPASAGFLDRLGAAGAEGADAEDVRDVRRAAREHGRFTRNFVVQGTAAEWALCWLASLRRRLRGIGDGRAHLAYFLHDEVVVHSPAQDAAQVADAVRAAADEAGRLLFGDYPVEFALDLSVVESYADA